LHDWQQERTREPESPLGRVRIQTAPSLFIPVQFPIPRAATPATVPPSPFAFIRLRLRALPVNPIELSGWRRRPPSALEDHYV